MRYRVQRQPHQKPQIGGYELGMQLETKSPYKLVFLDHKKREKARRLIQVLHDPDGTEPKAQAFFEREVAALKYLSQGETGVLVPHLYDSGRTFRRDSSNPFYYIVVEFLKGQTLFSNLPIWVSRLSINGDKARVSYKRGDLKDIFDQQARNVKPEDYAGAALDIIDFVDAVRQIHSSGVVHGDITPSNGLKIDRRIKLIDFEYSNIDGQSYSQRLPHGCAMRYADPNVDIRLLRTWESDLFSIGCVINDLFPFPTTGNERLSEFLANAYERVDAMDALPIDEHAAWMSELVKTDRHGFIKRMEDNPKEAERYLFALIALMEPPARVVDFENNDLNLFRSDRYHFTQAVIARGELGALAQTLQLEPVKRVQELGRVLMENQKKMTANELHDQLQLVRREFLEILN